MVTLRSRAQQEAQENLEQQHQRETMVTKDFQTLKVSGYEQFREERIKENIDRMQKLGIFDLSLKLKPLKPISNRAVNRKNPQSSSPLPSSGPVRRSSRLQNSTPICYSEAPIAKKDKTLEVHDLLRKKGSKPEFYTDEHENLLGSTEKSWTLFVDGCGEDGKRIYDPVRGKTCHQCRQKTLGYRTHCSKCNMIQGQFCGDCLYMRYGENVLETIQNPNWTCPVCRGICNCSLCRQAKGWPPTGSLYRKISSLGYKSVAHFLIQTRRSNTESDMSAGSKLPISVKRSLPFSDIDETLEGDDDLSKSNRKCLGTNPQPVPTNDSPCTESINDHKDLSISAPEIIYTGDDCESKIANIVIIADKIFVAPKSSSISNKKLMGGPEPTPDSIADDKNSVALKSCSKSNKKRVHPEPTLDSVGGRLRQRRAKNHANEEFESSINPNDLPSNAEATTVGKDDDSIARRLKMRRGLE